MKVSKTFSLEIEDVQKFEQWKKLKQLTNDSQAFRELLNLVFVPDRKTKEGE